MDDLYKANLILNDIFVFDEDGDMEKCKLEVKNSPLAWDFSPNGDDEWTYMLNRFSYLDLLDRAYKETSDEVYINKGLYLINNWIDNVKLEPSKMTRTLDTGMRIYHFINFISHRKIDNEKFMQKFRKSLMEQIYFLKNHYIEKYDLSNWGLVQVIAIAVAGIYFNNKTMYDKAIDKLKDMLSIQYIDESSIHWEKCIGYHNFMLLWLLRLSDFEKKHGYEISFKDNIKSIAKTTKLTSDLSFRQINNGDSDLTDIRFLLSRYEDIFEEKIICENHKFFENYGLYVEKNSDSYLSCYNQSMSSNHTHADFTHFNYQNKKLKIIDGGRYTYKEGDDRKYFKLFSHNNLVIDGISSMGYVSSWQTDYYPIINPIYVKRDKNTFVEMSYFDDNRNIFVKRRIFYIEEGDLIVFDQVKCSRDHEVKMEMLAENIDRENFLTNKKYRLEESGYFSSEYNKLDSCLKVKISEDFTDTYTQCMVFGNVGDYEFVKVKRNKQFLSDKQALAVRNKNKIIANIFEEITDSPRVFNVEGIKFQARAIVLNGQQDLEIYR